MKHKRPAVTPILALGLSLGGALFLGGCGSASKVGPAQTPPGQMGTDISPSRADVPIKNSQSTPIQRPD